MKRQRRRLYLGAAVLTAVSLIAYGVTVGTAGAEQQAPENPVVGQNAVDDPVPLLGLTNPDGVHLYTLSRSEADTAVAKHGLRYDSGTSGYLRQAAFTGSQPLHRLARTGTAGWLVTASAGERNALVASGRFRYEGVLGHASVKQTMGTQMLWRFSNGREWRMAFDQPYGNGEELLRNGYKRDGPLGYANPRVVRAGALYFGTWNSGSTAVIKAGRDYYKRSYDDPWAGVRDYAGTDPKVKQYRGAWSSDDFSDREPLIGYYDDAQTATVEKHIDQASSAGLDYFAFYWYWNPNTRTETKNAGLESFLRASNRNALDFGVTICAHDWDNGTLKIPVAQYGEVADRLVNSYLAQPNYLRANDGRRILWLCDTRGIGGNTASDTKAFVDTVRSKARAKLGEEILVLAHQDLGLRLPDAGADGDYCAAPYHAVAGRSYTKYVNEQRAGFGRGSNNFVRCVMSDFDERPRYPVFKPEASTVAYFPDHNFDLFREAARNVKRDMDAAPRPQSVVDNMVLVYAWNEWHEGGYIEPNARDGCRYLDILRGELGLQGKPGLALPCRRP
ncbi:glycoside hydrolase family 99-like domain-containing protein [Actinoplanes sp. NPDC051861]|uniref:glycoside hydrolase family 99-like domain-containing protein n=1 Tax=Actinoplanes sp. NPDC051861 TaxID=3155170 RepID=UPI00344A35A2